MDDSKLFKLVKVAVLLLVVTSCIVFLKLGFQIEKTGYPIIEDHDFIKEPVYFPWPNNETYYIINDYNEYERLMRKSKIATKEDFNNYKLLVIKSEYRYCDKEGQEIVTKHEYNENKMNITVSYYKQCSKKNCTGKGEVAGYYYMKIPRSVKLVMMDYIEVENKEC